MKRNSSPKRNEPSKKQKIEIHPALLGKEVKQVERPVVVEKKPKFNPYLSGPSKPIHSRKLKFNQPGKHIKKANELREAAQLDALKQQIAELEQETGLVTELELVDDLAVVTEPPPDIEWWDAPFLKGNSYDDVIALDDDHPLVTNLIQHPVPIQPTHEAAEPAPRPIMLTKKEQKKLRRQNRLEKQLEKREKV